MGIFSRDKKPSDDPGDEFNYVSKYSQPQNQQGQQSQPNAPGQVTGQGSVQAEYNQPQQAQPGQISQQQKPQHDPMAQQQYSQSNQVPQKQDNQMGNSYPQPISNQHPQQTSPHTYTQGNLDYVNIDEIQGENTSLQNNNPQPANQDMYPLNNTPPENPTNAAVVASVNTNLSPIPEDQKSEFGRISATQTVRNISESTSPQNTSAFENQPTTPMKDNPEPSPDKNFTPPPPIQPNASTNSVSQEELTATNKFFTPKKIIAFAGVILLLVCGVTTTVLSYSYLSENYVPFISGFTEGLYLSEGEQFNQRVENLSDTLLFMTITNEGSNITSDIDLETIKPLGYDEFFDKMDTAPGLTYDMLMEISYTLPEPPSAVLGTTDPGEINEDVLMKILEATNGEIRYYAKSTSDMQGEIGNKTEFELSYKTADVELSTAMEAITFGEDIYLYLDRFPRNDFINVEMISGQWIHLALSDLFTEAELQELEEMYLGGGSAGDQQPLVGIPSNYTYSITDLLFLGEEEEVFIKQEDYAKYKQVLDSEAFQNTVSEVYEEQVGEVAAKCYVLDWTKENVVAVMREIDKVTDESLESDIVSLEREVYPFNTLRTHICMTKYENFPVKLRVEMSVSEDGTNFDMDMSMQLLSMELPEQIEVPAETIEFMDMDWETIMEGYLQMVKSNAYDNTFEMFGNYYTSENICNLLPTSKTCTYCSNENPDCSTCLTSLNGTFSGVQMSQADVTKCL